MMGPSQKISNSAMDPEQLRRLFSSADGKRLMQLLQSDGGAALASAAAAIRRGDAGSAQALLSPLLVGEGEALAGRLSDRLENGSREKRRQRG